MLQYELLSKTNEKGETFYLLKVSKDFHYVIIPISPNVVDKVRRALNSIETLEFPGWRDTFNVLRIDGADYRISKKGNIVLIGGDKTLIISPIYGEDIENIVDKNGQQINVIRPLETKGKKQHTVAALLALPPKIYLEKAEYMFEIDVSNTATKELLFPRTAKLVDDYKLILQDLIYSALEHRLPDNIVFEFATLPSNTEAKLTSDGFLLEKKDGSTEISIEVSSIPYGHVVIGDKRAYKEYQIQDYTLYKEEAYYFNIRNYENSTHVENKIDATARLDVTYYASLWQGQYTPLYEMLYQDNGTYYWLIIDDAGKGHKFYYDENKQLFIPLGELSAEETEKEIVKYLPSFVNVIRDVINSFLIGDLSQIEFYEHLLSAPIFDRDTYTEIIRDLGMTDDDWGYAIRYKGGRFTIIEQAPYEEPIEHPLEKFYDPETHTILSQQLEEALNKLGIKDFEKEVLEKMKTEAETLDKHYEELLSSDALPTEEDLKRLHIRDTSIAKTIKIEEREMTVTQTILLTKEQARQFFEDVEDKRNVQYIAKGQYRIVVPVLHLHLDGLKTKTIFATTPEDKVAIHDMQPISEEFVKQKYVKVYVKDDIAEGSEATGFAWNMWASDDGGSDEGVWRWVDEETIDIGNPQYKEALRQMVYQMEAFDECDTEISIHESNKNVLVELALDVSSSNSLKTKPAISHSVKQETGNNKKTGKTKK